MSLFDISTLVRANLDKNEVVSVGVVAAHIIREAIYDLGWRKEINPIANCRGLTQTTLLFSPHDGYSGQMTASMVYALACLAHSGWTPQLFCSTVTDIVVDQVRTQGFDPDIEVVREVQKRFTHHFSTQELIRGACELNAIPEVKIIIGWCDEAIECQRRLQQPNSDVTRLVTEMCNLTQEVLEIDNVRRRVVEGIEKAIESYRKRQLSVVNYDQIVNSIAVEKRRLSDELTRVRAIFNRAQWELMINIRRLTPAK